MNIHFLHKHCSAQFNNTRRRFIRLLSTSSNDQLVSPPPPPPPANPIHHLLLGPPEIYLSSIPPKTTNTNPLPSSSLQKTTTNPSPPPEEPFMNAMVSNFNNTTNMMGLTENNSPTCLSSGNPCLDFFFHVVPSTPPREVIRRLDMAWKSDPLKTLKLIANLRGVRGTGKSDNEGFYTAALWLHENHPKTLACNVKVFADFGYYKDLPEILFRMNGGLDVRKKQKRSNYYSFYTSRFETKPKKNAPREERIAAEMKRMETAMEKARELRHEKFVSISRKAIERYAGDSNYRFLHDAISEVFADQLVADLKSMNSGDKFSISLASKWCPNLDSSFDRFTLLCESIARRVFCRDSHPEYEGIQEAYYAYRVRDRLRKEVLVPLRRILELPEIYICSNRWDALPYNRVASVAMKTYKDLFMKHDESRFKEFLGKVKCGKAKISAGALLPHEIIASLDYDESSDVEVAELQWQRMVEDLSREGKLNNCLAICDVSGSMSGTPMEVSVALGLLVSEMTEDPWKGKLITFSESPELHKIEGEYLRSKTKFIENMAWDCNTDFQKVFDVILQVAINGKLPEDQMIKRLFVFSDMEFDEASANNWETDYQVIQRKFKENGYSVPEIVFWNLRDSKATPVPSHQKGVALVGGFSKNLLKLFLKGGGILNPEDAMESAIARPEYEMLVVVD